MKRLIIVLMVVFLAAPALAKVETHGLTESQIADIKAQVAITKAENVKSGADTVSQVVERLENVDIERYSELGKVITKTITETAQGLGMAVDEFVGTTTGSLVMLLILYHFLGADFVTFVIGFFVMLPASFIIWNRMLRIIRTESYKEDDKGKMRPVYIGHLKGDRLGGYVLANIVGFAAIALQVAVYLP